eukprot:899515-Amphidinium_carterae.1
MGSSVEDAISKATAQILVAPEPGSATSPREPAVRLNPKAGSANRPVEPPLIVKQEMPPPPIMQRTTMPKGKGTSKTPTVAKSSSSGSTDHPQPSGLRCHHPSLRHQQ